MTELYPRLVARRALLAAALVALPLLVLSSWLHTETDVPVAAPSPVEAPPSVDPEPQTLETAPPAFRGITRALDPIIRKAPAPSGPLGRALERYRHALERCYAKARKRDPGASGDVQLRWYIASDGEVSRARVVSRTTGKRVATCLKRSINRARFPELAPKTGAWATHTFQLRPRERARELRLEVVGWERLVGEDAAYDRLAEHVRGALDAVADCYAARDQDWSVSEHLVVGMSRSHDRLLLGVSVGATVSQRCVDEALWVPGPPPTERELVSAAKLSIKATVIEAGRHQAGM